MYLGGGGGGGARPCMLQLYMLLAAGQPRRALRAALHHGEVVPAPAVAAVTSTAADLGRGCRAALCDVFSADFIKGV